MMIITDIFDLSMIYTQANVTITPIDINTAKELIEKHEWSACIENKRRAEIISEKLGRNIPSTSGWVCIDSDEHKVTHMMVARIFYYGPDAAIEYKIKFFDVVIEANAF